MIEDAKLRMEDLQAKVSELELYKYKKEQENELKMREECIRHESNLKLRIQELEGQLREEKTDCQSSRDLLIRAQMDLQELRQTHADDVGRLSKLLEDKDRQVTRLQNSVLGLEKQIRDKDSLLDSKGELLRTHEKLRRELEQLRIALQTNERDRDDLLSRNKQLDSEVKSLRRTLSRRSNDRHSAKTNPAVATGYTVCIIIKYVY